MAAGLEIDPEHVTIQYIGAPRYRVVITAEDYKEAEDMLKEVTTTVIASIKDSGGEGSFSREANK
jgi:translation initiation factor 2 subunit 1